MTHKKKYTTADLNVGDIIVCGFNDYEHGFDDGVRILVVSDLTNRHRETHVKREQRCTKTIWANDIHYGYLFLEHIIYKLNRGQAEFI